jgi:two-component system chemotaxis response regulator CheB
MELIRPMETVRIRLHEGPAVHACRPSVDVLFCSAAPVYDSRQIGVILTGMGVDGLAGCRALASLSAPIVVQDEASSVIWGMPGAVCEADLADEVLDIDQIGEHLLQRVQQSRSTVLGLPRA